MSDRTAHFSSARARVMGAKQVIAVGSGKGGVGKSTVSLNLACSMAQRGLKVGLLDADIYGPNQPHLCGIQNKPDLIDNKFKPIHVHDLYVMSLGFLVEDETPLVWRGPMVSKMLQQLLFQTAWPDLDILILDLPPGTGDVQLTLAKKTHLDGAIIVTTPQYVATQDAQKGLAMFQKVDVPIVGVVENMSYHTCTQCGHAESIFGEDGGEEMAQRFSVPLLARLPLQKNLRAACDSGLPYVNQDKESELSRTFAALAQSVSDYIKKPRKPAFPDIVVE